MVKIQMTYNSSILVNTSSTEYFIQGAVDLGKGHWAGCNQTHAILCSLRAQFG
jgi:hypothetical protein